MPTVSKPAAPGAPGAQGAAPRKKRVFDVDFINPFLEAVVDVLTTMAQVIPAPGKPFLKESTYARGEVTGIVAVTGHAAGSIALTFPVDCAKVVVANMLGEEIQDVQEIKDGVGELTNMISGQARKGLATKGMKFHAGIPQVMAGKGHPVRHLVDGPVIAIPFSTPYGDITVEVCLS